MSIDEWVGIRDKAQARADGDTDPVMRAFHENMVRLANIEIARQVQDKLEGR